MDKPFIVVCGVPHSYTSMVSKFLIDNGAYTNEVWDNPKWDLSYSRFEEKELQKYVGLRKKFKKYDLSNYFASLPEDKVIMAKAPLSIFFINELNKFTNRRIKVVYVIRQFDQIILSSKEKNNKSFIYNFERISWLYDFMVNCKFELLPFISERINKDGPKLLEFCEIKTNNIDYSSIGNLTKRSPSYSSDKFKDTFWKKVGKFLDFWTDFLSL